MRLDGVNIDGMQTDKPLFHIVEFLLVDPVSIIDLLLEELDLLVKFLPLTSVGFEVGLHFALEVGNFIVLNINE